MSQVTLQSQPEEMWATIELMGHGQSAGRISRPSEWGGLLRVDVPEGDGYRTEFYGLSAIYKIKFVSEQIARVFAAPTRAIVSYDTPIVTREQHEAVVRELERRAYASEHRAAQLERRLTTIELPLFAASAADSSDDPEF